MALLRLQGLLVVLAECRQLLMLQVTSRLHGYLVVAMEASWLRPSETTAQAVPLKLQHSISIFANAKFAAGKDTRERALNTQCAPWINLVIFWGPQTERTSLNGLLLS